MTQFIMLYGVTVALKVLDTHHCRLLLVQGGLEIPIQITVTIKYSTKNNYAMDKLMVTDESVAVNDPV